jgi:hypothetical protein
MKRMFRSQRVNSETHERIGSHRRPTPVDRSTDFRNGLKPLKARPKPTALSRVAPTPLFGEAMDTTRRRRNGTGSDERLARTSTKTPGGAGGVERRLRRSEGKPSEGKTP